MRSWIAIFLILVLIVLPFRLIFNEKEDSSKDSSSQVFVNRKIANESARQITEDKQIKISKVEESLANEKFNSSFENILGDKNRAVMHRAKIENDFLKKYKKEKFDFYINDSSESWSVFTDVNVTLDKTQESLLQIGPYKITSSNDNYIYNAKLIYDENQKVFAILTGRIVATLNTSFDSEQVSDDYRFRLDSVNADIKTAYYSLREPGRIDQLRGQLAQDPRVKSFYFEVVNNQWQKN
jgi:hypothetical protein